MQTQTLNIDNSSKFVRLSAQWRQSEQLAHHIALWAMLLLQEVSEASGSKVGGASGGPGGVNLGVSEVGQSFAICCDPPCKKDRCTYSIK